MDLKVRFKTTSSGVDSVLQSEIDGLAKVHEVEFEPVYFGHEDRGRLFKVSVQDDSAGGFLRDLSSIEAFWMAGLKDDGNTILLQEGGDLTIDENLQGSFEGKNVKTFLLSRFG